MNKIRAKFLCHSKEEQISGHIVKLEAVYDSNPSSENGMFFKWTPQGEIKIGLLSGSTAQQFIPGQEYYVDFTKCTPTELQTEDMGTDGRYTRNSPPY